VAERVGLVAKLLSILHRTAVATDFAVTQIVSQKKDDVRTGGGAIVLMLFFIADLICVHCFIQRTDFISTVELSQNAEDNVYCLSRI